MEETQVKRIAQVIVVACVLGTVAGAVAGAQQKRLLIHLQWRVNIELIPLAAPAVDMTGGLRTLKVESVVDKRDNGNREGAIWTQIGENTQKKMTVPILTDSNVAEFVTNGLLPQLKSAGLPVVRGDAELVLRLELTEFWATETTRYRASVRMRCTLTDVNGKEVWMGMVGGVGENWGRSLKDYNYNETFTSAVFDLVTNLLKQDAFMRGLKKTS
jgi:hypothetical protein